MDWSIQEVARHAGTTSRALRHYGDVGLLEPSRIGSNGYRYYDDNALLRLQRILLLRELGLGLPAIADALASPTEPAAALRAHLDRLHREQARIARQIGAVERTLDTMSTGEQLMAESMFDGFEHTQYKEEVEERWGAAAYARGDSWWRSMTDAEKLDWQKRVATLAGDWIEASRSGAMPDSEVAQALASRQVEWLASVPGTPGELGDYVTGLGEMYVADDRFAANYGGQEGAAFVRDALAIYAERNL